MPRPKGSGKGETERFNIRLDPEAARYYRNKANEHGISISEYLRQTLVQGVIAENVNEIEARLGQLIAENTHRQPLAGRMAIPDELLLSVFTTESILSESAEAQDVQRLYRAHDIAKAKLNRLKTATDGSTSGQKEYE